VTVCVISKPQQCGGLGPSTAVGGGGIKASLAKAFQHVLKLNHNSTKGMYVTIVVSLPHCLGSAVCSTDANLKLVDLRQVKKFPARFEVGLF